MTRTHKWYILDKTHSDYATISTAVQSSMADVPNTVSTRDNNDNTKNNTGLQSQLDANNFVDPTEPDRL